MHKNLLNFENLNYFPLNDILLSNESNEYYIAASFFDLSAPCSFFHKRKFMSDFFSYIFYSASKHPAFFRFENSMYHFLQKHTNTFLLFQMNYNCSLTLFKKCIINKYFLKNVDMHIVIYRVF